MRPSPPKTLPAALSVGTSLTALSEGEWVCTEIDLPDDESLKVQFRALHSHEAPDDWLEVLVCRPERHARFFHKFDHCVVRYRANVSDVTNARRQQIGQLVMDLGAGVDSALAVDPAASMAQALGADRRPRRVVFGRDTLTEMLAPHIVPGEELAGGWKLDDVFPSQASNNANDVAFDLTLEFVHHEHPSRIHIVVGPHREARPAVIRTQNLAVTHYQTGLEAPLGTTGLVMLVGLALRMHDHPKLTMVFPDVASDIASLLQLEDAGKILEHMDAPPLDTEPVWLNLAVSADCGQDCVFCSVRDLRMPYDSSLARLSTDLRGNREAGVTRLRINGYDPLAYTHILELVQFATGLGYTEVHIFSPCTRLADKTFCHALLTRLPRRVVFFVPIYGADAETHDTVVGTVGAFDALVAACANIESERGPEAIHVLTALTEQGLAGLPDVVRWTTERGWTATQHLPFPSKESRTDRYHTSAPRQTDVARVVADACDATQALLPFRVAGVAPCVAFRQMRAKNVSPHRWLTVPDVAPALPGTEYRRDAIVHRHPGAVQSAVLPRTVPCPHVEACVLSQACSQEILVAYVERFGAEEFQPVTLSDLVSTFQTTD